MNNRLLQGQSAATLDKERCLASALSIGAKIANKFGGRSFRYWHFDANAGCGWNEEVNVPGSPIVFHTVADQYLTGMRREAFFSEINKGAAHALLNRTRTSPVWAGSSYVLPGDNEEGLQVFAESIRRSGERAKYAIGSIIVDPNGYWYRGADGVGPPIRPLIEFSLEFPRIDIIVNLNTQFRKRFNDRFALPSPDAVLNSLNKLHWLVKRTHKDGNQWLLAVGRNFATGPHKRLNFHDRDSPEGREIMLDVEGKRQGRLIDDLPILRRVSAPPDLFGGAGCGDEEG